MPPRGRIMAARCGWESTNRLMRWVPRRVFAGTGWVAPRAVLAPDENAPGGRPFLDSVEIEMGKPLRDQAIDFGLGKADVVELDANESRRPVSGRKGWSSRSEEHTSELQSLRHLVCR